MSIKAIKDIISAKEHEQQEAINQSRAERAELAAKLAELEEKQAAPASLEEYKKTAQEIRDTQAYISYIDAKAKQVKTGVLNDADLNDIRAELFEAITAAQADAAPEIQKVFFEVIDLMEKYTANIAELEELLIKAQTLNNPRVRPTSSNKAAGIYNINPDKCGYWQAFCYMFYNTYSDAMRIKHAEAHPWKK